MKKVLAVFLLSGLIWFVLSKESFACSCAPSSSAKEALGESSAVFIGRLISARLVRDPELGEAIAATFQVERYWKGVQSKEITVVTASSGVECGIELTMGQWYLVYAGALPDQKGKLHVTKCGRTGLSYAPQAQSDIKLLGTGESFD